MTNTGILVPLWYAAPNAYKRLQALMLDPRAIIVETRATPHVPRRPEWCRWGERGLQRTGEPCHWKVIVELLRLRMPDLQVIL